MLHFLPHIKAAEKQQVHALCLAFSLPALIAGEGKVNICTKMEGVRLKPIFFLNEINQKMQS